MDNHRIGFTYHVEHLGRDGSVLAVERVHNIIPTVGLNYFLSTALAGGSAFTSWYLGLFEAQRTPLAGDTMTSLLADCDEVISYTQTTGRQAVTFGSVSGGSIDTTASPNVFVFPTGATVRGAFITTTPGLGGTTGLLLSAGLFNVTKTLDAGESLRVPAGFDFY